MKDIFPIAAMIIASGLLVFGTLVQNRIQRACVDYGELVTFPESTERPDKLSFTVKEQVRRRKDAYK
jgi:hypothetical protein